MMAMRSAWTTAGQACLAEWRAILNASSCNPQPTHSRKANAISIGQYWLYQLPRGIEASTKPVGS